MKYILGADPGITGCIALIPDLDIGKGVPILIDFVDIPDWEDQVIDVIQEWASELKSIAVELTGSAPRNAASRTEKLARSAGTLRGLLKLTAKVYKIPYTLVSPQRWQSEIGLVTSKEELYEDQTPDERKKIRNRNKRNHKKAIYVFAKNTFPRATLASFDKGGSNQADALAIAYWMREKNKV